MHHFLGGIFTRLDGRNPNFRVPEIWKAWILDWSSFRASTAVPPPSLPISKYIVIAQHTFRSIYANHLQSNKGVVQHPRRFFVSVHNTMSTYLCRYILVCHQIFCSSINWQLPALFTSYFCDSSSTLEKKHMKICNLHLAGSKIRYIGLEKMFLILRFNVRLYFKCIFFFVLSASA